MNYIVLAIWSRDVQFRVFIRPDVRSRLNELRSISAIKNLDFSGTFPALSEMLLPFFILRNQKNYEVNFGDA